MARGSRPTSFTSSTLIRLLARWADVDSPKSGQAAAERLSQWISWTHAVSLSSALNGSTATASSGTRAASAGAEEDECVRVRAALAKAIVEDHALTGRQGAVVLRAPAHPDASKATPADFSPYRQHYLARQQAMEKGIGPLRSRLRKALAAGSPDLARLAAVDAVMDQALEGHERSLLSAVPTLLERHFERLRSAHREPSAAAQEPGDAGGEEEPSEAWRELFHKDMQAVLLAELDVRFQPVEGLLEALRTKQPSRHE